MSAPQSIPNVGSQLDRAIVAYLVSLQLSVPGFAGDATCIFPAYTWRVKGYPNIQVHSQRSQHDPPMSGVQKYQVDIRCEQSEITNAQKTGQESQRVYLDTLVGQMLFAMLQSGNGSDLDYTAGLITVAGRNLATSDPVNNGDMATFTCQHIQYTGDTRGEPNEEGASWVEVRNFLITCNPSNT